MPRPKLTPEQKVQNAIKRNHHILAKYDNSREVLCMKYAEYIHTKDPTLKHACNNFKQMVSNESIIKKNQESNDDETSLVINNNPMP